LRGGDARGGWPTGGADDGAEVQQCDAPGLTGSIPQAQTAATTTLGRFGQEGLTYTPAQEVSVCPAGETLPDRVGSEEQGRTIRDDSPAAGGRCALKAHCTRTKERRRMTRGEDGDGRERRQQRLAHQPVHPSQLALYREFRRLLPAPVLVISRLLGKFSHSLCLG
jgi:hypothetical protein